jgi:hypothetical protein
MPTIKISEKNKAHLDHLLATKIGEEKNPAVIMDDVVTELLEAWSKRTATAN